MRTSKPLDREELHILKTDRVLEVGSGHNPCYRSNVLVDRYVTNNSHRCGDLKIYQHQKFIEANGEDLPFKDKEFDYVICNQVLEHVDNPYKFVSELARVAKRGYIETPSLLGEHLFPKDSHKWVILDIDDKLVLFEKDKMPGNYRNNYGRLFLDYLPFKSLAYKLLWITDGDLMLNRYEWKDSIDIIVNPTDDYYRSFFIQPWTIEIGVKLFPQKGTIYEVRTLFCAILRILKYELKRKMFKGHRMLNIEEYNSIF